MTIELEKIYQPHEVEKKWSRFWEDQKLSVGPETGANPSFSIVIPPPNVTGSLHIGHALNNTLQDILVRTARMQGKDTLWVFGTDHAGIATQNVVERQLAGENLSRHDLGREKLIDRIWKWKAESGGTIRSQLHQLGASVDWSRERFTMDEGLSKAVKKVFVQLHQEGLIYQANRLINWCPRCQTSLSDLEVEHEEKNGKLYHIRYPFLDHPEQGIVVATTRPETLFGDTAVAVHPDEECFKKLQDLKLQLPLTSRIIPLIKDDAVNKDFGTGAVKITPAHDFNDFEMGKRHQLSQINILTPDGKIISHTDIPTNFHGLDRFEARKRVVQLLEENGLLVKAEEHKNAVGHCYRCKTIVEPYLSKQWYVKAKPLAEPAIEAVKKGETNFYPKFWENTYFSWMENIQDWCISRQIWWGHRIPVWYCQEGENKESEGCSPTVSEETPHQCAACGSTDLKQDEDVLDTWFSSALWPFSTLGWPEETDLLKKYYPTSVLVTSFDIIFFWVARMMMMGLHFMKEVPFKDVYIHALVRDAQGQKMSKSKGNVVNPLELMDKFGTDALRFTLTAFAAQGRDIKLDEQRVEGYRNFCNKIWNAARFLFSAAAPLLKGDEWKVANAEQPEDRWIQVELNRAIVKVTQAIDEYKFNEVAAEVYQFFWNDFCDWYLELIKSRLYRGGEESAKVAAFAIQIFEKSLRLLHPIMPFITEELWQKLPGSKDSSIMTQRFPSVVSETTADQTDWKRIDFLCQVVSALRTIRSEAGILPKTEIFPLFHFSKEEKEKTEPLLQKIKELIKASDIHWVDAPPAEAAALGLLSEGGKIYVPLAGIIDPQTEKNRLLKKLEKTEKDALGLSSRLINENFIKNAPPELVQEVKRDLEIKQKQKDEILEAIKLL